MDDVSFPPIGRPPIGRRGLLVLLLLLLAGCGKRGTLRRPEAEEETRP